MDSVLGYMHQVQMDIWGLQGSGQIVWLLVLQEDFELPP